MAVDFIQSVVVWCKKVAIDGRYFNRLSFVLILVELLLLSLIVKMVPCKSKFYFMLLWIRFVFFIVSFVILPLYNCIYSIVNFNKVSIRRHVQTFFGKINDIVTLTV